MAHILLNASYAPSLVNFRGKLIEAFIERGHKVSAVAPNAAPKIVEELREMGVAYYDAPLEGRGLNPIKDLFYFFRLLGLMRRIRPDVVLSYTIKPVVYGSVASSLAGVKTISSMITGLGYSFSGSSVFRKILNFITVKLYRFSIRKNHLIFFQNPDDREVFRRKGILRGGHKTVLINGSGVDVDHFSPQPFPSEPSFLMIARLVKEKGLREYFQAAAIIRRKYPGVRFRLVGGGGKGTSFISEEELAAQQKAGIIDYLGELEDVRPAIAGCSVYVLPSYAEGTPKTVLEAMAMGRPIITSDAPGCRETVSEGENGFLVAPGNVRALVETMERFIVSPRLIRELGEESRRRAVRKYDVHKVNEVILRSYGF